MQAAAERDPFGQLRRLAEGERRGLLELIVPAHPLKREGQDLAEAALWTPALTTAGRAPATLDGVTTAVPLV